MAEITFLKGNVKSFLLDFLRLTQFLKVQVQGTEEVV